MPILLDQSMIPFGLPVQLGQALASDGILVQHLAHNFVAMFFLSFPVYSNTGYLPLSTTPFWHPFCYCKGYAKTLIKSYIYKLDMGIKMG
jgi:hypothetical protein